MNEARPGGGPGLSQGGMRRIFQKGENDASGQVRGPVSGLEEGEPQVLGTYYRYQFPTIVIALWTHIGFNV